MADTYEAFYNGKPLNPNRGLPTMTYAQAEDCGLTESERLWCRTDGEDTPITADDIPYSTGVSVKNKIDDMNTSENLTLSTEKTNGLAGTHIVKNGIAYISGYFTATTEIQTNQSIGKLSKAIKGSSSANWFGVRADNLSNVRGYVMKSNGNTELYPAITIPQGSTVVFTLIYETE